MDSKETYSSPVPGKRDSVLFGTDDSLRLSSAKGYGVSSDTNMEIWPQSFQLDNNKGPILSSPPIAMSLRTRETSSMALKQIFDHQQMINGASSTQRHHQQMGGSHGMQNQFMTDLCKRSVPDLDLSSKKAEDYSMTYPQTGFGSPISTPTYQSSPSQAAMVPMNGQLMQHNIMPQAVTSARLYPSSRQSTAQMTIFYLGNVNVYDDVPADKAHAIMLLAGNLGSSSFRYQAPPIDTPVSPPQATGMMRERSPSPINSKPSQHTAISSTNTVATKSFAPPAPSVPFMASSPSPPPPPSPAIQTSGPLSDSMKSSQAGVGAKRQHAGIELPHARKASLARFLEKRKDRVQPQGGVAVAAAAAEEKGGEESSSYDVQPELGAASSSNKKQCIEAASHAPSLSRSDSIASNGHEKGTEQSRTVNEHCFFH